MTLSWTQPQCEACWIEQEAQWDDDEILIGIRMPVAILPEHRVAEQCAWCGKPTIMGIYKRVDPSTVTYPTASES